MEFIREGKFYPPSSYLSVINETVRRASVGSIAPILVNNWRTPKWEGVGTGFVVVYRGQNYFVTANHVLDCAFKYKQVVARLCEKIVSLHGLYFAGDPDSDIAVTLLPWKWLESYGITTIYAPGLESLSSNYQGTGQYVFFGYPASQNIIDPRWHQEASYKATSIFAQLEERKINISKIPASINVHYDHKAYGQNLPALQGMSGGPLFEIMSRRIGNDKTGLSINPRGVLCEWHKRQRVVVGSSIESVIKLIEDRSSIWKIMAKSHAIGAPSIWTL